MVPARTKRERGAGRDKCAACNSFDAEMNYLQSRPDFVARALGQFAHAARQLAQWPDVFCKPTLNGAPQQQGAEGSGDFELSQRYVLAFLTTALLPLPAKPVATPTAAFVWCPFLRLPFLPPSRGPPRLERQQVRQAISA